MRSVIASARTPPPDPARRPLLAGPGAEDGGAGPTAHLRQPEQEAAGRSFKTAVCPLVGHGRLEGGVLAGELAPAPGALLRLSPEVVEVETPHAVHPHAPLAGGYRGSAGEAVLPVPVGPHSTTFRSRSANPHAGNPVIGGRPGPLLVGANRAHACLRIVQDGPPGEVFHLLCLVKSGFRK